MKKLLIFFLIFIFTFSGCSRQEPADIAATTLPVWEFTQELCSGTGLTVSRLVTENVSCLHDYALQVTQMRAIESAQAVVCVGAGLEDALVDSLSHARNCISAADNLQLQCSHVYHGSDHHHKEDPHVWLSPEHAMEMCRTICNELTALYPEYASVFAENLTILLQKLEDLQAYGENSLKNLRCREFITFHDGFTYFAESFDLHILKAIEEESGSEASAKELTELIALVKNNNLPAIFTETNGSTAAAEIIARETSAKIYMLDMAISGDSYFDAMYHNIDTIKEALG